MEYIYTRKNLGDLYHYQSHDIICEVDDENDILKGIMNEALLNSISVSGVPNHNIYLKVGDICLILRHLLPLGLATNQRVKIARFFETCIMVQTLDDEQRAVPIPRIRFKFAMRGGNSYKILRTQYPLRLSYCMTYNKSQGQTLGRVLLDTTEEPFAHGHSYVAMSRVRQCNDIKLYCKESDIIDHEEISTPTIKNIVYQNVLLSDSETLHNERLSDDQVDDDMDQFDIDDDSDCDSYRFSDSGNDSSDSDSDSDSDSESDSDSDSD